MIPTVTTERYIERNASDKYVEFLKYGFWVAVREKNKKDEDEFFQKLMNVIKVKKVVRRLYE